MIIVLKNSGQGENDDENTNNIIGVEKVLNRNTSITIDNKGNSSEKVNNIKDNEGKHAKTGDQKDNCYNGIGRVEVEGENFEGSEKIIFIII